MRHDEANRAGRAARRGFSDACARPDRGRAEERPQNRYSPLTNINRENVKRLVPAWSYSMADNRGQEAQPLVRNGIIYLTDHEKTVAIDGITGRA